MINWVSIDGVTYHWNGTELSCDTKVGFHSNIDGHRLDGLDITDNTGNIIGQLYVDFDESSLFFHAEEISQGSPVISYSQDGNVIHSNVADLPAVNDYHDILLPEENDVQIWQDIAQESTASVFAEPEMNHTDYLLTYDQVMEGSVSNLDPLLGTETTDTTYAQQTQPFEMQSVDLMATNTEIDPLDFLLTHNAHHVG